MPVLYRKLRSQSLLFFSLSCKGSWLWDIVSDIKTVFIHQEVVDIHYGYAYDYSKDEEPELNVSAFEEWDYNDLI